MNRSQTTASSPAAFLLLALVLGVVPMAARSGQAPSVVAVPAGVFVSGSDRREREAAYALDEAAYGHSRTRTGRWYENEPERHEVYLPAYAIMATPVTMEAYARFVSVTDHRDPDVDRATWEAFGLIHPWDSTRAYAWRDGMPPPDKANHPVVLVSHDDARAYADWLSLETGQTWRLPSEAQWEKAARGTEGAMFPWGETWDPTRLNSHDRGPFATTPVGAYPEGASPFGMLDAAGQVFEWTDSPSQDGRFWIKGGSWDDRGCGVCRPADRHSRPERLQHILLGFRLVLEP